MRITARADHAVRATVTAAVGAGDTLRVGPARRTPCRNCHQNRSPTRA